MKGVVIPAKDKKPQVEIPEDALIDELMGDDEEESQVVFPQAKPDTVSEVDWVDQQTDVPIEDEDDDYL